jgi:hypothetical protein
LVFEDVNGKLMVPSSSALSELLARHGVKTVLLNACYSLSVGKIASIGLDYTVASTGSIFDPAAIEFTRGFYDALGAGRSVPDAFEEGISSAKLKNLKIDSILLRHGEEYIPPVATVIESEPFSTEGYRSHSVEKTHILRHGEFRDNDLWTVKLLKWLFDR